jgi:Immunity protein 8
MVTAHLISLDSPDLPPDALPLDPENCSVVMNAAIGPKGSPGAENFAFTVVTPRYLAAHSDARWGRGLLVIDAFSWPSVARMVERLLAHASGSTWGEVAAKLNHELLWEFDKYTPSKEAVRAV